MASPFRTRNAQLFARLEAAWAGTLLLSEIFTGFNPTFKPNYDQNEDQSLRASFGKYPVIAGGVSADLQALMQGFPLFRRNDSVRTGKRGKC